MVHSQRLCCLDFVWWHIFWPWCHPLHRYSTEAEWKLIDIQSLNAVIVNALQHCSIITHACRLAETPSPSPHQLPSEKINGKQSVTRLCYLVRDVQDCQQRLNSAFDLLSIFLCSLIQTLTLTPPPNNTFLANLDMYILGMFPYCSEYVCTDKLKNMPDIKP